jgi:hypothetical protein
VRLRRRRALGPPQGRPALGAAADRAPPPARRPRDAPLQPAHAAALEASLRCARLLARHVLDQLRLRPTVRDAARFCALLRPRLPERRQQQHGHDSGARPVRAACAAP